uniref:Uncharacterized protein n=1 Tax=Pseudo-nitzschia australis TaxID=44445 RepID=A0A7S4EEU6_9STRA|mmetsp:Transcript_19038/g.40049  ORF Transcript_19038/g.40049 Transcript_19038/m.40049 type:complete len:236 (+) Transcript_19038:100-807(+)
MSASKNSYQSAHVESYRVDGEYVPTERLRDVSSKSPLLLNFVTFFIGAAFMAIISSRGESAEAAIDFGINPTRPGVDARQGFNTNEGWGNQTRDDGWPSFHFEVFHFCPHMINFLYENQVHPQSKIDENNVIYDAQHNGAIAEDGFAEVLQQTLPKFYDYPVGYRLNDRPAEISAFWTLHIRIARGSADSNWHDFASSLPEGITRIYVKRPLRWDGDGDDVALFGSPTGYNILVY